MIENLIIHFVWYLEKEERHGIENLLIDRLLNQKHFYGLFMQRMFIKS